MKKVIFYLLSIILILALVGCNDNSSTKNKETTSSKVSATENSNKKIEKFNGESEYLSAVTGVWIYEGDNTPRSGIKEVEIKDDYTIIIDGQKGAWDYPSFESFEGSSSFKKYTEQDINNFKIWVEHTNATDEYTIQKIKRDDYYDKFYTLRIEGYSYVKKSDFNIVEINLQNYTDYFEISDYAHSVKDDFGDYIGGSYGVYLCIKDGVEVDGDKSSVEYKYSFTNSYYGVSYDKNTDKYKLLGVINKYNDVYTPTEKCTNREDGKYAGIINSSEVLEAGPGMGVTNYDYVTDYPENIKITGIKGKLFIINN